MTALKGDEQRVTYFPQEQCEVVLMRCFYRLPVYYPPWAQSQEETVTTCFITPSKDSGSERLDTGREGERFLLLCTELISVRICCQRRLCCWRHAYASNCMYLCLTELHLGENEGGIYVRKKNDWALKGIAHLKTRNSVIIYSTLCCFKLGWIFWSLEECLLCFFLYNESQWRLKLLSVQGHISKNVQNESLNIRV